MDNEDGTAGNDRFLRFLWFVKPFFDCLAGGSSSSSDMSRFGFLWIRLVRFPSWSAASESKDDVSSANGNFFLAFSYVSMETSFACTVQRYKSFTCLSLIKIYLLFIIHSTFYISTMHTRNIPNNCMEICNMYWHLPKVLITRTSRSLYELSGSGCSRTILSEGSFTGQSTLFSRSHFVGATAMLFPFSNNTMQWVMIFSELDTYTHHAKTHKINNLHMFWKKQIMQHTLLLANNL